MFGKRLSRALALTVTLSLLLVAAAFASDATMSIADTTAPTGAVELAPGGNANISIVVTVTGAQAGTSSYKVYKDWTLDSTGTWTGSNEATSASIGPRAGGDAANVQSFSGKVYIDSGVECGDFTLAVKVHGILNSNTTGGKLEAGIASNYSVTVADCVAANADPILTVPADMTVEGNTLGGANVTYTGLSATDAEDGNLTSEIECSPADGSFFSVGGPQTVNCSVEDSAGASDSDSFTVTVVDTTAPDTSIDSTPNATVNSTSASFTFSGTDIVSAAGDLTFECKLDTGAWAACTSPQNLLNLSVGSHTFQVRATDEANNTDATPASYSWSVQYQFSGFFNPIDGFLRNSMKAGSTAPIKFSLSLDGQYVSSLSAINQVTSGVMSCTASAVEDALEEYATGGTSLRYDTANNQFIYNWQSPKKAGNCYKVVFHFADGTSQTVQFGLR